MTDVTLEKRIDECIRRVSTRWNEEVTDFMPKKIARQLESSLNKSGVYWSFWGGYNEAERGRIFFSMNDRRESVDFGISLLEIRGNMKYVRANHRDYLGALMSLGFIREKMGDLIVRPNGCDVFITDKLAPYVCEVGLSVKKVPMTVSIGDIDIWLPPEIRTEQRTVFVKSMRLDAVVAQGFGIGRSEAAKRIQRGEVTVSYQEVLQTNHQLLEDDLISVRGLGKLRVGSSSGKSKKGRTSLILYRYL